MCSYSTLVMPQEDQVLDLKPDRASRMRENKRRHRARKREYLSDLEQKLAQVREQGVQATKEVQLAAQKVSRENARLRELLRQVGVADHIVDDWAKGHTTNSLNNRPSPVPTQTVPIAIKCHSKQNTWSGDQTSVNSDKPAAISLTTPDESPAPQIVGTASDSGVELIDEPDQSPLPLPLPPPPQAQKSCKGTCPTKKSSHSQPVDAKEAPCKLLTRLAENPEVDITQIPLPSFTNDIPEVDEVGVECGRAYQMCMQYAKTEQEMDEIVVALEKGCTPLAEGGCRVRNDVVWGVLDRGCG
ncbi:uncharacterized protein BDR25DRAFT_338335 [Lindgomyces ingoldianus]|uniref:Uncharacterized protein n=1 Tax=Lindgomyces ingoldianus TaxID=673940 RepID=A0ACB6RDS0_9PLEO|nr:uncharacterized protein BDR25DRAFT_338335 [Lindgomyces ingoldianus]KAF2477484.1 hypothetical protein BDR25DRAFT_338335 [Lindgomyces ingoldianus]